jgi:hypothetical protein
LVKKSKRGTVKNILFIFLLIAILITSGCIHADPGIPIPTPGTAYLTVSVSQIPPAVSTYATDPASPAQDPIIGSWLNGMVFYANGSVGSDGTTTWKVNGNKKNSYFVLSDVQADSTNARDVISKEWIYIPGSDSILRQGSSESVQRGIPVFTPAPAVSGFTVPVLLEEVHEHGYDAARITFRTVKPGRVSIGVRLSDGGTATLIPPAGRNIIVGAEPVGTHRMLRTQTYFLTMPGTYFIDFSVPGGSPWSLDVTDV